MAACSACFLPSQIIMFGSFVCLDSFLYTFTILPLRALIALRHLVSNLAHNHLKAPLAGSPRRRLRLSHKCDLTKAAILIGTLSILHHITDASKMYHGVRGQDTVKLYVLFNVLEVGQRSSAVPPSTLKLTLLWRSRLRIDYVARSVKICKTRSSPGIPLHGATTGAIHTSGHSSCSASTSPTSVSYMSLDLV